MFDYVQSEVPLPDGYTGDLQSRAFDCVLTTILIRADGRLLIKDKKYESVSLSERPFPDHPLKSLFGSFRVVERSWRDLNFHGEFEFSGYEQSSRRSHHYVARFTHGQLQQIEVLPEHPAEKWANERLTRAVEFQRSLLQRAGGTLTTDEVKSVLGYRSDLAVQDAVAARNLLAVNFEGKQLFPRFQFDHGKIAPGLAPVLLAAPSTLPWALLQFFVEGDEGLGSDLPMDLIKGTPDDVERAVRFARTLED